MHQHQLSGDDWYRPTPVEVATGWPLGIEPAGESESLHEAPLEALERVILPDLLRKPCYVLFSGGIDSSLVLSVATRVARREGLDPPVPVTKRSPSLPGTREDDWQQLVIDHLKLSHWIRIDVTEASDLVGPSAQDSLLRNGLAFPSPVHVHGHVFGQLGTSTLFTGEGGDEVLGQKRISPMVRWWNDHPLRHPRRGLRMTSSVTRRAIARRVEQAVEQMVWLRPDLRSQFARQLAADVGSEPLTPADGVRWMRRRRAIRVGNSTARAAARQSGVDLRHPLLDPRFVEAVAGWMRPSRAIGRATTVGALFGGLLPEKTIQRSTKAQFNPLYFGDHTRAFAQDWTGDGLDPDLVDANRLRDEWLGPAPSAQTALLLQAAWIATRGSGEPASPR